MLRVVERRGSDELRCEEVGFLGGYRCFFSFLPFIVCLWIVALGGGTC